MNLYGYAGGDPVNYSDPFGLCPPQDNNANDCPGKMGALVQLGQMAPVINESVAGFLPAAAGVAGGGAALAVRSASLTVLRAEYVGKVSALAETGRRMLGDGEAEETVARTLSAARRALGVEYKGATPLPERMVIYGRNLLKYGDRLGPTVDYLRAQGKSWADIINKASQPGGGDLGLRQ